jgi:ferredoxin-NADP reductase
MALEFINWLQDISEHLRVSRRRDALRQPGKGVDYTGDEYKDVVQRVTSRLHPKRMKLRVTEILQETPTTKTLCCQRTDGPLPPFRPGQYVNLFVDVDGVLTSRPYSISSPPRAGGTEGGLLELTVRDKPGGFVAPYLLHEVQVGDELETTGPAGHFYHEPLIDGDDLVFLAGGSGITPFMSIIRDVVRRGEVTSPLQIHLLYGSRVLDDVIFGEELAELARKHPPTISGQGPSLNYTLVISEPPPDHEGDYLIGFLDAGLIREQVGDIRGKTFYICGPPVMVDFCLAALKELGVPPHKIRRELFGPPEDVTQEPGWPAGLSADTIFDVKVVNLPPTEQGGQRGGRTVRAPAGEPLMNTLERYGIIVPAVCRTGACSACRTKLLSGRVFMPAHTALRQSDREHGYIHACMSYPLENLQIRL